MLVSVELLTLRNVVAFAILGRADDGIRTLQPIL